MPNDEKHVAKVDVSFHDIRAISKLVNELRYENRFFLSELPQKILDRLIEYGTKYKIHGIRKGFEFFRSRINEYEFEVEGKNYSIDEMGAPPRNKAKHGRINPVGIPYLYLSSDIDTAVAEVRPWNNCKLTVAKFRLNRDIEAFNFSNKILSDVPNDDDLKGAEFTWRKIMTFMFSMPFDPRDDTGYIPIQYISEKIKGNNFDGILYDSALNESGYNICLFDVKAACAIKPLNNVEVKSIEYQYEINSLKDK